MIECSEEKEKTVIGSLKTSQYNCTTDFDKALSFQPWDKIQDTLSSLTLLDDDSNSEEVKIKADAQLDYTHLSWHCFGEPVKAVFGFIYKDQIHEVCTVCSDDSMICSFSKRRSKILRLKYINLASHFPEGNDAQFCGVQKDIFSAHQSRPILCSEIRNSPEPAVYVEGVSEKMKLGEEQIATAFSPWIALSIFFAILSLVFGCACCYQEKAKRDQRIGGNEGHNLETGEKPASDSGGPEYSVELKENNFYYE